MELNPILYFLGSILERKIFTEIFSQEKELFKEILQTKNFIKENNLLAENLPTYLFSEFCFPSGLQNLVLEGSDLSLLIPFKTFPKINVHHILPIFLESQDQTSLDKDLEKKKSTGISIFSNFKDHNISSVGEKNSSNIFYERTFEYLDTEKSKEILLYLFEGNEPNQLNELSQKKDTFDFFIIHPNNNSLRDVISSFSINVKDLSTHLKENFESDKHYGNNVQLSGEKSDKFIISRLNFHINDSEMFESKGSSELPLVLAKKESSEDLKLNIIFLKSSNEIFSQKEGIALHKVSEDIKPEIKGILNKLEEVLIDNVREINPNPNERIDTIRPGNFMESNITDQIYGKDLSIHSLLKEDFENVKHYKNGAQLDEVMSDKFVISSLGFNINDSEYFKSGGSLELPLVLAKEEGSKDLNLNIISPKSSKEIFSQEEGIIHQKVSEEIKPEVKGISDKLEEVLVDNEKGIDSNSNDNTDIFRLGDFPKLNNSDQIKETHVRTQIKIEPLEVYQQIGKQIIGSLKNNGEKIRLTLDPPELGCIHVEIRNEQRKVELFFWADRALTKDLLEANRELLVEILRKDGFRLERLEVFFQQDGVTFQNDRENQIDQNRKFFKENRKVAKYQPENELEIDPILTKYFSSGSNYIDLTV